MAIKSKIFIFKIAVLLFFFSVHIPAYAAGTPLIFSYQGRISNTAGNLLGGSGTTYYFKFSIWDNATAGSGSKLWPTSDPTSYGIVVRDGVFNANIGDTANGYPDTLNLNFNTNKDIYLQVEVSANNVTFETITPRQRISSAVFAQIAGAVSGTGQSSFGTTTPIANSVVTVESTSTSATGVSIRGFVGQLADLFHVEDFSLNHLFSIGSGGGVRASSTLEVGPSTGSTSFIVNSTGNVGVGTSIPGRKMEVLDVNSVPQLRLSQTAAIYGEFYVDSAGDIRISSTGGNIRNNDENFWVCAGGGCGVDTPADKGNIIVENAVIFNNKFKLKQIDASTTRMYDSADNVILEFDEGQ